MGRSGARVRAIAPPTSKASSLSRSSISTCSSPGRRAPASPAMPSPTRATPGAASMRSSSACARATTTEARPRRGRSARLRRRRKRDCSASVSHCDLPQVGPDPVSLGELLRLDRRVVAFLPDVPYEGLVAVDVALVVEADPAETVSNSCVRSAAATALVRACRLSRPPGPRPGPRRRNRGSAFRLVAVRAELLDNRAASGLARGSAYETNFTPTAAGPATCQKYSLISPSLP